ncbi:cell wall hydrolase [Butyrivibrio fibrisolvens]|uniref:cell wall hydrolase n=1 Tax=Butyrivibrio fibrisolvens TaxID=831 RepID=UPI0009B7AC85|nr:cell wall hydrolase [Butyrivibrio fibrisolvens]
MKNLKRVLFMATAMAYAAAVLSFTEPIVVHAQENETQDVTTDVTDVTENTSESDNSQAEAQADDVSSQDQAPEDAAAQQAAQDLAAAQAALVAGDPIGYDYEFTMEEIVLMANVVYREARGSFNGQVAVAEVIMNRVKSPAYPNTIKGVLSQKNQFSTYSWASGRTAEETSTDMINLCLKVLSGEYSYLNNANVLSFKRNDGSQTFYGKTLYTVVDNQAFYSI